jgi:hypothetical protein
MPRIRLNEPELVPELLSRLREKRDCIATREGDEIHAAVIGSYGDGGAREIELLLREWQREHPGLQFELTP